MKLTTALTVLAITLLVFFILFSFRVVDEIIQDTKNGEDNDEDE